MRYLFLLAVLSVVLNSCSPYGYPSTTADSIEDIRWQSDDGSYELVQAPLLDCHRVADCDFNGEVPDQYQVGGETVYVWTYNYLAGLRGRSTLFWVVVYRPDEDTWDGIGFEYFQDQERWMIGAYGGTMLINGATYRIWHTSDVGFSSLTALGMSDESWAIIVSPINANNFNYVFIPSYWEEEQ